MMYDAIIILGSGVNDDSTLLPIPKQRVATGIALFEQQLAPTLIMTGKWSLFATAPYPISEAAAMAVYAVSRGVPEDAVIKEEAAMDTIGNAYYTKTAILEPRGWRSVIVLTSDFHLVRTRYIFDKVLGTQYDIKYVAAPNAVEVTRLSEIAEKEHRVLTLTKELLDPIADGDHEAIQKIMNLFPGYSDHPAYTKEELLEIVLGKRPWENRR